jgi:hypothetical protein
MRKVNTKSKRPVRIGDYVFACKWSDADPNDPWCVDFVDDIIEDYNGNKWYKVGGRSYRNCRRISADYGSKILEFYPKIEEK